MTRVKCFTNDIRCKVSRSESISDGLVSQTKKIKKIGAEICLSSSAKGAHMCRDNIFILFALMTVTIFIEIY